MYGAKFEDATRIMFEFYSIQDTFENFWKIEENLSVKALQKTLHLWMVLRIFIKD